MIKSLNHKICKYYSENTFFLFFSYCMKMSGKSLVFNDKKINNFCENKKLFKIDDIDKNKILISKRKLYHRKKAFKYFIGYDDNDDIIPLCINLLQIIGYAKYLDGNKNKTRSVIKNCWKSTLKYGEKISCFMNKEFDSEPVCDDSDKYIKINSYGDKVKHTFSG